MPTILSTPTHSRFRKLLCRQPRRCIPQSKPSCKIKHAPLPYWNDDCKNTIYERNRARNKLNNKKSPENAENYKRLKGIAQKTIKKSSQRLLGGILRNSKTEHQICQQYGAWQKNEWNWNAFKDTKPHIWRKNNRQWSIDKENFFANSFSKISSDENYSSKFRSYKRQIEQQKEDQNSIENEIIETGENTLDDGFNLSKLRRAIRETKKHSSPGDDSYIGYATRCYNIYLNDRPNYY